MDTTTGSEDSQAEETPQPAENNNEAAVEESGQPEGQENTPQSDTGQGEKTETGGEAESGQNAEDGETGQEPGAEGDDSEESEDEIRQWAEQKGLSLDDPIALARNQRNLERKLNEQGQEVGQLRQQVGSQAEESTEAQTEQDAEQSRVLAQLKVTDFYLNNPEAKQYDQKMAEVVKEKPYLANDLDALLTLAKAKTSDEEKLEQRQKGKQEALQQVNQSQRQGAPKTSATKKQESEERDPFLEGFEKG